MPTSQWVSGQLVWAWTTLILVSITWVRHHDDEAVDVDDDDDDHLLDVKMKYCSI